MGKMTVYHGSYTSVPYPEIRKGRNTKDFGTGFYCTVIREQAERWAKRYDQPMVNVYTVRFNSGLNILEFKEMSEQWLDFIINCRNGVPHDYDIVIGAMANDQIYMKWPPTPSACAELPSRIWGRSCRRPPLPCRSAGRGKLLSLL